MPWATLAIYLGLVSLGSFALFGWDKFCAVRDMRRVPEATLLWSAAWGGSPGALLGQRLFRHKTRKEPFRTHLRWIVIGQLVLLAILLAWWLF